MHKLSCSFYVSTQFQLWKANFLLIKLLSQNDENAASNKRSLSKTISDFLVKKDRNLWRMHLINTIRLTAEYEKKFPSLPKKWITSIENEKLYNFSPNYIFSIYWPQSNENGNLWRFSLFASVKEYISKLKW